jgi:hypothetical protein
MPAITPADALIKASDNLIDAIAGLIPKPTITADAIEQLMKIYKIQAHRSTCKAQAQRVLREKAQAQRVAEEQQATAQQTIPSRTPHRSQFWKSKTATPKVSATQEDPLSYPKTTTRAQRTTHVSNTSHER